MSDKIKVKIWGRELELGVTYDSYSGEEILDSKKDAVKAFVNATTNVEKSLELVKKYCLTENSSDIGASTIDNIFKFVAPKYLYVVRDEKKHIVSIMCNYKFDMENGIAVVFENEQFSKIGKQDIIL